VSPGFWLGEGMALSEHFFALPTDLPSFESQELRRIYEDLLPEPEVSEGHTRTARILEIDVDLRIPTVRVLLRLPLADRYGFVGSLTIPLVECSWVVKLQVDEGQVTGMREAVAFDAALRDSDGRSTDEIIESFDPYDRRWDNPVLGDSLTAVRRHLDRLQASLECHSEFYEQASFPR
jgi:hypothetical protein